MSHSELHSGCGLTHSFNYGFVNESIELCHGEYVCVTCLVDLEI